MLINSIKDNRKCEKGGVYKIKCKSCPSIYIGETLRELHVRTKEHEDACRLHHVKKSAVAKHYWKFLGKHEIDWKDANFIEREGRT